MDPYVSTLWESVYDGSTWSTPQYIVLDALGMGVAAHNGQLVLATRNSNNDLYTRTSTGNGWSSATKIVGQKSKSSPALASFGGVLHMTHLGDSSNSIWWSTWDGATWTNNVTIPGQYSQYVPALAVMGSKLVQAHIGDSTPQLWYSTFQ